MKLIQKFILGVFLLTSLYTVPLFAQTPLSTYEVHDVISGGTSEELWHTQADTNNPGVYITRRVMHLPSVVTTTEVSIVNRNWWLRRIQTKDAETFYEEFLASPPLLLEPGESSFGYIYVRDSKSGNLTETWPLFLSVELYRGAKKVTFTVYMSNNRIMEVSRFYVHENYFFPLIQEVKIYKPGVDPKTVPVVVNPGSYLDTYLRTKRIQ